MFTGLIKSVGVLKQIQVGEAGAELGIDCRFPDLEEGESVAVNGACLTVREVVKGGFVVGVVPTTLERTAIANWLPGRHLNLERALQLGDRLGGHMVQGHVDGVGSVRQLQRRGDAVLVNIDTSEAFWELLVPLGSLAVDGVSLTVNSLPDRRVVQVSLIEYTLSHTALADIAPGDEVHLEADLIGKYVRGFIAPYLAAAGSSKQ